MKKGVMISMELLATRRDRPVVDIRRYGDGRVVRHQLYSFLARTKQARTIRWRPAPIFKKKLVSTILPYVHVHHRYSFSMGDTTIEVIRTTQE